MVDEGLFARYPIGSIYAVHNWPGVAEGHIAVRPGAMMARFDTFDFGIKGQGGHAALPHLMRDPMIAAGQVIVAVQSIVARNIDAFEQAVVSITFVNGGEVYNVVPDVVRIGGTVRTLDDAVQDRVEARLKAIATGLSQSLEVEIDFTYERKFPITSNATREAEIAQRAARRVVGKEAVETDFRPSMGAEDFSVMLQNCPGAFAFLGVGPSIPGAGLHQSSYDFNDRVLGLGASYYTAIVSEELS